MVSEAVYKLIGLRTQCRKRTRRDAVGHGAVFSRWGHGISMRKFAWVVPK